MEDSAASKWIGRVDKYDTNSIVKVDKIKCVNCKATNSWWFMCKNKDCTKTSKRTGKKKKYKFSKICNLAA